MEGNAVVARQVMNAEQRIAEARSLVAGAGTLTSRSVGVATGLSAAAPAAVDPLPFPQTSFAAPVSGPPASVYAQPSQSVAPQPSLQPPPLLPAATAPYQDPFSYPPPDWAPPPPPPPPVELPTAAPWRGGDGANRVGALLPTAAPPTKRRWLGALLLVALVMAAAAAAAYFFLFKKSEPKPGPKPDPDPRPPACPASCTCNCPAAQCSCACGDDHGTKPSPPSPPSPPQPQLQPGPKLAQTVRPRVRFNDDNELEEGLESGPAPAPTALTSRGAFAAF